MNDLLTTIIASIGSNEMDQSVRTQSFSEKKNQRILRFLPLNLGNNHLSLQRFLKRDDLYNGLFHYQVKPFRKIETEYFDETQINIHAKKIYDAQSFQAKYDGVLFIGLVNFYINNNLSTQNTTFCVCTVPQLRLPLHSVEK